MAVQVVAGIMASRTGVPPMLWSYLGVDGEVEKIFPMCLKTIDCWRSHRSRADF